MMEINENLIKNLLNLTDSEFQKTLLAVAKAADINPMVAKAQAAKCRILLQNSSAEELNALLATLPKDKADEILRAVEDRK